MRRLARTLAFAALSLAFAPAPFPKAERPAQMKSEAALVRECLRRLDELGVGWEIVDRGGRPLLRYSVRRAGYSGSVQPGDGNLLRVLRRVVEDAELALNEQRTQRPW